MELSSSSKREEDKVRISRVSCNQDTSWLSFIHTPRIYLFQQKSGKSRHPMWSLSADIFQPDPPMLLCRWDGPRVSCISRSLVEFKSAKPGFQLLFIFKSLHNRLSINHINPLRGCPPLGPDYMLELLLQNI